MTNNFVFLQCELLKIFNTTVTSPLNMMTAEFEVRANNSKKEEYHRVIATGKTAAEVIAAQKANLLPLACALIGWIGNEGELSVIQAENVLMTELSRGKRSRLGKEMNTLMELFE